MSIWDTVDKRVISLLGMTALGPLTKVNSLSMTHATDDPVLLATGALADAAWTGAGSGSIVAVLKGIYGRVVGLGATPAYATPVAVGAASTLIKAANTGRTGITVMSATASPSRVYLGADNTVTAGPSGKNFGYLDPGDTYENTFYNGAIYGICDTGGSASVKYLEVAL